MSIFDAIRNSVLEGFDNSLTASDMILGLSAALLASLFILLIYRHTARQISFNRSFCMSLLLVCSISAMMVLTITSNLALSLGMVGALSIVRFRTAVKDATDTAFLFWAVAAGITSGAGFYLLTLIGCLFIGVMCVVASLLWNRVDKPFLLVVRVAAADAADRVEEALKAGKIPHKLTSLAENDRYTEIIYELAFRDAQRPTVTALKTLENVQSISLVDCRKS